MEFNRSAMGQSVSSLCACFGLLPEKSEADAHHLLEQRAVAAEARAEALQEDLQLANERLIAAERELEEAKQATIAASAVASRRAEDSTAADVVTDAAPDMKPPEGLASEVQRVANSATTGALRGGGACVLDDRPVEPREALPAKPPPVADLMARLAAVKQAVAQPPRPAPATPTDAPPAAAPTTAQPPALTAAPSAAAAAASDESTVTSVGATEKAVTADLLAAQPAAEEHAVEEELLAASKSEADTSPTAAAFRTRLKVQRTPVVPKKSKTQPQLREPLIDANQP